MTGLDFLPTICELTGIALPSDRALDGTSVAPVFTDEAVARSKPLYWEYITAPGAQVSLRDGEWKILAQLDGPHPRGGSDITEAGLNFIKTAGLTGFELYNIAEDPRETIDLATTNPRRLAELRRKLENFHQEVQQEAPRWPLFENPREEQARIEWPDYVALPLPEETTPRRGKKARR